jgi:DNA-binding beta-propeller fold protein YncE
MKSISLKKTVLTSFCIGVLLSLHGCGSSNSSTTTPIITPPPPPTTNTVLSGQFTVAGLAVEGLSFMSASQTGHTDSSGTFLYEEGETVTLSLGTIIVAELPGKASITPLDIFSESNWESISVQNMYRLFRLLDSDQQPENGISIYQQLVDNVPSYENVDFNSATFDQDLAAFVTDVQALNSNVSGLADLYVPTEFSTVTTLANLPSPYGDGITLSPEGDILISGGYDKDTILRIDSQGLVSDFAGGLPGPVGMGFDSMGNIYISNYSGNSITKIDAQGLMSVFASGLDGPSGLMVDSHDQIFVSLFGAGFSGKGASVLKFTTDGSKEVFANGNGLADVIGVTKDEYDNLYASNYQSGALFKIANGQVTKIAQASGKVNQIIYSNGYVYLPTNNAIERVSVFAGSMVGEKKVFSGNGSAQSIDGNLAEAAFNSPINIAVSKDGNHLYVLDQGGKLRQISVE